MEMKFFNKPAVYVEQVKIKVSDLEDSLTYYQEIIGFQVLEKTKNEAVLTADGKSAILRLEELSGIKPKEERAAGLYHFAILLPTRADLSAFLRHVAQRKVRIGASDHYVSEAFYLNDPDGTGIEVYHDRPSSEWSWSEGNVAMATEPLDGEGVLAESTKEWKGLPEETRLGHIHLHVSELQKAKEFYVDALGFDIVTRYPGALFLSTNGYHHHIAVNVWKGEGAPPSSKQSVGMTWYTLVFPDEETREKAIGRLQQDASVIKEQEDYVTEDPSGNRIRLQVQG